MPRLVTLAVEPSEQGRSVSMQTALALSFASGAVLAGRDGGPLVPEGESAVGIFGTADVLPEGFEEVRTALDAHADNLYDSATTLEDVDKLDAFVVAVQGIGLPALADHWRNKAEVLREELPPTIDSVYDDERGEWIAPAE